MALRPSPLLCRSPLQPGESLLSLVTCLAELNKYPSSSTIANLCQEYPGEYHNVSRPRKAWTYNALSELVRIPAGKLYAASYHRFAATITPPNTEPTSLVLLTGRKVPIASQEAMRENIRSDHSLQFCPHCLKEALYHRLGWMPLAAAVCLEHQCLLVHRCSNCQEHLKVEYILTDHYPNCGFRLTHSPTISVADDEFGLFSQFVIQSWMWGTRPPVTGQSSLTVPDQLFPVLYRVLEGLRNAIAKIRYRWDFLHQAPFCSDCSVFPYPKKKKEVSLAQSYLLRATALKGLVNWPHGFYNFLDAYSLRDGRLLTGHLGRDLGSLYLYWLETSWKYPEFGFLQNAFNQNLLDDRHKSPYFVITYHRRSDPKRVFYGNKLTDFEVK